MAKPAKSNGSQPPARRTYKNPPITEATCEFQFAPVDNWNLAYTGLFLERVKSRYAGKPREQRLLQLDAKQLADASGALPSASVREITKVQIPSTDGKEMVAVGPGILSAHVLKPYSGWEAFRPQIEEALTAYRAIADPSGIRRIGIRYINLIDLPARDAEPSDYFSAPPTRNEELGCRLDTFVIRHEYLYDDEPVRLVVNFARVQKLETPIVDAASYLLDLDVSRDWQTEPLPMNRAMSLVDELRRREREAFEAQITPKARELFDA